MSIEVGTVLHFKHTTKKKVYTFKTKVLKITGNIGVFEIPEEVRTCDFPPYDGKRFVQMRLRVLKNYIYRPD